MTLLPDEDVCYRAVSGRDARFDGWFFTAVTSTGIYCRPSCPALTPKRENVRFYPTAAAAQHAGFRACMRCRPDAAPGSPLWNVREDLAARAMRLIADGVVDQVGVRGLAQRLGYTERHLTRQLTTELGAGPLALARAQRAHTARTLIETTNLTFAEIAFAAGFASIRQFNDTVREIFAASPTALRRKRHAGAASSPGTISLRLAYREPLDVAHLWPFFASRAIAGVEEILEGAYRRTLLLPHGTAVATLRPADGYVHCELILADVRDLTTAVHRCRRLLDLDADPEAVDTALADDPALRARVRANPGRRVPSTADPSEAAIRAVIGQQISVAAACTVIGQLTQTYGTPLPQAVGSLTRAFPTASALADADPATLPMPQSRKRTLLTLCQAIADNKICLDVGTDAGELTEDLVALPGIGPWTANYIAMRGLAHPDTFLASDLGVIRGAAALGLPTNQKLLTAHAQRWRPWRSYAVLHLWN